jgi:hypothetical protein
LSFTTADRWLITDDVSTVLGDPTNTHVVFGPGSPLVTPSNASETVFLAAATNGVLADFALTVPGNGTIALLFFYSA